MPIIQSSPVAIPRFDRDGDISMSGTGSSNSIQQLFTFDYPLQADTLFRCPRNSVSVATKSSTTSILSTPSCSETSQDSLATTQSATIEKQPKQPVKLPPHPTNPLSWMWQCHLCHSRYPLHVTRRCLIDGHYYCSGDPNASPQRNVKRKKRGQSCTSEFDYVGWQNWGKWRKKTLALLAHAQGTAAPVLRGCNNCEYPSECRYEKKPKEEVLNINKYLDPLTELVEEEKAIFSEANHTSKNTEHQLAEDEPGLSFKSKAVDAGVTQTASSNDFAVLAFDGSNRFYANMSDSVSSTSLSNPELAASVQTAERSNRSTTSSFLSSSSPSTSTLNAKLQRSQASLANVEVKLKAALAEQKLRSEQERKTKLKQKNASRVTASDSSELTSKQNSSTDPLSGSKQSQDMPDSSTPSASCSNTGSTSIAHTTTNRSASRWKQRRSNVSDFEDIALNTEPGPWKELERGTFSSKTPQSITSSRGLSSSNWSTLGMFGRLGKSTGTEAEG